MSDSGARNRPLDPSVRWSIVVEVSPQWYGLKGALADQPCPAESSTLVPLDKHTSVVGRSSTPRAGQPDVVLDTDTGVSRRHAQLVRDGEMLTVVDLSSTNGTYVLPRDTEPDASASALVPGVPVELRDGDRVFIGAWTSLTARVTPAD